MKFRVLSTTYPFTVDAIGQPNQNIQRLVLELVASRILHEPQEKLRPVGAVHKLRRLAIVAGQIQHSQHFSVKIVPLFLLLSTHMYIIEHKLLRIYRKFSDKIALQFLVYVI